MLSRATRLSHSEFKQVFDRGRHFSSPHFELLVDKEHTDTPKCAVVASKKVAHGAVARNRLRRRGYALLEEALFSNAKTHIILLIRSNEVATFRFSDLLEELSLLGKRI